MNDLPLADQAQYQMFRRFLVEAGPYEVRRAQQPEDRAPLSPDVMAWALGAPLTDDLLPAPQPAPEQGEGGQDG